MLNIEWGFAPKPDFSIILCEYHVWSSKKNVFLKTKKNLQNHFISIQKYFKKSKDVKLF